MTVPVVFLMNSVDNIFDGYLGEFFNINDSLRTP